jgi:protein-disulfide isomerase
MKKYFLFLSLLTLTACTTTDTPTSSNPTTSPSNVTAKVLIPSPSYGSGKNTITLFADFQCPACIAFAKIVGPILEEYASKGYLTIVYKQYPLTRIHANALGDAVAALCSAEQGKYMDYKKALYALEEAKS